MNIKRLRRYSHLLLFVSQKNDLADFASNEVQICIALIFSFASFLLYQYKRKEEENENK
jgi:hypothetical protein